MCTKSFLQKSIPAMLLRGGTSKGVFFEPSSLPQDIALRNKILLSVVGSPDRYGKQIDGLGGATSSTSKVVLVSPSERDGCDVDYLFGHVSIKDSVIDYSGNCGNLTAAVGMYAILKNMVNAPAVSRELSTVPVSIWQANVSQRIITHIPCFEGIPIASGDYYISGVPTGGAEILIDFLDPGLGENSTVLPTGNVVDTLRVPRSMEGSPTLTEEIECTLLNAGNPTVFVRARDVGLTGTEQIPDVNANESTLSFLENIRCIGAVAMGLSDDPVQVSRERPGTPKVSFVSPPQDYVCSNGELVKKQDIDCCARIMSMGGLHHAFTGTGGVAISVAACIPDSVVSNVCAEVKLPPGSTKTTSIGHTSGTMQVTATVSTDETGQWKAEKVSTSRSARLLMSGSVHVPLYIWDTLY